MVVARPVLSIAFGFLLVASLFLKLPGILSPKVIAVTSSTGATPTANFANVAALLSRYGFGVSRHPPDSALPWVAGAIGHCSVQIFEVSHQGWEQSLITQVSAGKNVFYAFGGDIYSEQPIMKTRVYFYWRRLKRALRLPAANHPVLAIIATQTCKDLPLHEISTVSDT